MFRCAGGAPVRLRSPQRQQCPRGFCFGGGDGEGDKVDERKTFDWRGGRAAGVPPQRGSARTHVRSLFAFSTIHYEHERAFPYCRLPLLEFFSWLVQFVQFISHPLEKLQRRKAKGFTDGIDRGDGGIPFSFYDSTDIAILQIRKVREGRFGHLSFFSDFFDCNASGFQ